MYPIRGYDIFVWIYRDNREVWKITTAPNATQTSNWPESLQNNLGFIAGRNIGLPFPTLEVRWEVWDQSANKWHDANSIEDCIECSESKINLPQNNLVPTARCDADQGQLTHFLNDERDLDRDWVLFKSGETRFRNIAEGAGVFEGSFGTIEPNRLPGGSSMLDKDGKYLSPVYLESSTDSLKNDSEGHSATVTGAMSTPTYGPKSKSLKISQTKTNAFDSSNSNDTSVPPSMVRFEVLSTSRVHAAFTRMFWWQHNMEVNGSPVWRALISFAEPREFAGQYAWMYRSSRGLWKVTTGNHLDAPLMHKSDALISGTNVCDLPTHEINWAGVSQDNGKLFSLQAACTPVHETPAQKSSMLPLSSPLMERSQSELDMEIALETSRNEWVESEHQRAAEESTLKRTIDISLATNNPRRGLENLGNTCYLNSSLQLLAANANLRDLMIQPPGAAMHNEVSSNAASLGSWLARPFLTRQPSNKLAEMERARALRDILIELTRTSSGTTEGDTDSIRPSALHDLLPWPFNGFDQQDADEALHEVLLECLEKGGYGATSTSASPLTHMYGGEIHRQMMCLACSDVSSLPPEPINALHLPLEGPRNTLDDLSVMSLIDAYFADNTVVDGSGDNGEPTRCCDSRFCRGTRQHAIQTTTFHKVPQHLLLALKRFVEFGGKKSMPVILDETLKVRTASGETILDLYAIIVHSGPTPNSGHYFAYACDSGEDMGIASSNGRQQWYKYDDSRVTPVTQTEWDLLKNPAQTTAQLESDEEFSNLGYAPTPYILCYRRRDSETAKNSFPSRMAIA